MINSELTTRQMQTADIAEAIILSTAEGWNQTETDWRFLIENGENECLAAVSENTVIATTVAINYSEQLAWIAMVLVQQKYRSLGIASSLLSLVLEKADRHTSIKLDATPAGRQIYKKFGFKDEYLIVRMTAPAVRYDKTLGGNALPEPVEMKDLPELVALDSNVFGARRKKLITYLIEQPGSKGWILKRGNLLTGSVFVRGGNRYHQVGPVIAETTVDARTLILSALAGFVGQPVVIDILSDKEDIVSWLSTIGFERKREFTRMYKEENPSPGIVAKMYATCGPEYG